MEVEFRGCRVSRDVRQGRYSLDGSDSDYMMRVLESFVMSRAGDIGGGGDFSSGELVRSKTVE